jgi:hypothetical protein
MPLGAVLSWYLSRRIISLLLGIGRLSTPRHILVGMGHYIVHGCVYSFSELIRLLHKRCHDVEKGEERTDRDSSMEKKLKR